MKQIYVFLSKPNTFISSLIGLGTRSKLSHVSLSLNDKFDEMYSFARKGVRIFPAGFKRENIREAVFLKNSERYCEVKSLFITDEEYETLLKTLSEFCENEKYYKYSYLGAFLCWIRVKKKSKNDKKYFCSQFVSKILSEYLNIKIPYIPELMRPKDILKIEKLIPYYNGTICDLIEKAS